MKEIKEEKDRRYYYTVEKEQEGLRLDQFLAAELTEHSRSYIQKLIKGGKVTVNEKAAKAGSRIQTDDRILLMVPPLKELEVLPENIPLDIIYEDEDVILINKPKDMVVHPCPGRYSGTLVNGLLAHCGDSLSGINGVLRPGIVHRIDKDTTGVLVVCKTDLAHRNLAEQLKEHSITRKYEAIVHNNIPEEEGIVDAPIGRNPADRKKMAVEYKNGKKAVTHYRVLDHLNHQFNHIEASDIRFSVMKSMDQRVEGKDSGGSVSMPGYLDSFIRGLASIWSLKRRFRNISGNFCVS